MLEPESPLLCGKVSVYTVVGISGAMKKINSSVKIDCNREGQNFSCFTLAVIDSSSIKH